jgi:protease I
MRALMLTADGVEDLEFYYPFYRLLEDGIKVDVAGTTKGTVTGKHGYEIRVELPVSGVEASDYDILILPGGKAPETIRLLPVAVKITQEMMKSGKPVAAICHGAQILISAQVLKGRKATCWKGIRDDLIAAGGQYEDEEVVVDGNLITSRCPDDLPAFWREVKKALAQ